MSGRSWRVPFLDLAAMHAPLRADLDAVWSDAVDRTAFIGGDLAARFEQRWAEYCGVAHCVGVANGTDSIELILLALDVGPGDEVIVPANTFIATAEAVVARGATPVYVDVDPDTLLVTAAQIEPAITGNTAAIIPVHLYGQTCEMDRILALAESNDVPVLEDAAQAHGATWCGRRAGSLGTAASFSFYPGKNLGAFGDAGAVVTDDDELAARVRSLSNHGRADGHHVGHSLMGRNSRLDGIQGGVLSVKLAHLDKWNEDRRQIRGRFRALLDGTAALSVAAHPDAVPVWHLNVVQVPERDRVLSEMHERGIDVRIHYPKPCHHHPMAGSQPPMPVVDASTPRLLSLPIFPGMEQDRIDLVANELIDVLADLGHPGP